MDELKAAIPDWAKDLRLNLGALERSDALTGQQLWGAALASALATRQPGVIRAVSAAAEEHLDDAARDAARTAAALMGMNNVYYRFTHLVGNDEYGRLPARLRMQALGAPGVDKLDFELWCLAVSAVNGCGACMTAHERNLRAGGVSALAVQDAVRIASILHGVATVADATAALEPVA